MSKSVMVPAQVDCEFCMQISEKQREIHCEGYKKNVKQVLKFRSSNDYQKHLKTYCERFCDSCPTYRLIMKEKYDSDI